MTRCAAGAGGISAIGSIVIASRGSPSASSATVPAVTSTVVSPSELISSTGSWTTPSSSVSTTSSTGTGTGVAVGVGLGVSVGVSVGVGGSRSRRILLTRRRRWRRWRRRGWRRKGRDGEVELCSTAREDGGPCYLRRRPDKELDRLPVQSTLFDVRRVCVVRQDLEGVAVESIGSVDGPRNVIAGAGEGEVAVGRVAARGGDDGPDDCPVRGANTPDGDRTVEDVGRQWYRLCRAAGEHEIAECDGQRGHKGYPASHLVSQGGPSQDFSCSDLRRCSPFHPETVASGSGKAPLAELRPYEGNRPKEVLRCRLWTQESSLRGVQMDESFLHSPSFSSSGAGLRPRLVLFARVPGRTFTVRGRPPPA